jgi:hypothetical protein
VGVNINGILLLHAVAISETNIQQSPSSGKKVTWLMQAEVVRYSPEAKGFQVEIDITRPWRFAIGHNLFIAAQNPPGWGYIAGMCAR